MSNNYKKIFYRITIMFISILFLGLIAYSFISNSNNSNKQNETVDEFSTDKILTNKKINVTSKSGVAEYKFENYKLEKVYRDNDNKKIDSKTGASFTDNLPEEYYRVTLKFKLTNISNKTFDLSYGSTTIIDGENKTFNSLGDEINNSFSYEGLHEGVLKPKSSKNINFYMIGNSKNFFNYKNMTLSNDGFGDPSIKSDNPSDVFSGPFDYKFN